MLTDRAWVLPVGSRVSVHDLSGILLLYAMRTDCVYEKDDWNSHLYIQLWVESALNQYFFSVIAQCMCMFRRSHTVDFSKTPISWQIFLSGIFYALYKGWHTWKCNTIPVLTEIHIDSYFFTWTYSVSSEHCIVLTNWHHCLTGTWYRYGNTCSNKPQDRIPVRSYGFPVSAYHSPSTCAACAYPDPCLFPARGTEKTFYKLATGSVW